MTPMVNIVMYSHLVDFKGISLESKAVIRPFIRDNVSLLMLITVSMAVLT